MIPMQYRFFIMIILLLFCTILCTGCLKDVTDPVDDSGHEPVTTLTMTFHQGGELVAEAVFDDPDGPGGNDPVRFDTILLHAGQTYDVSITLADKTKDPPVDMTPVIRQAGHQHMFFFVPDGISGLQITITDTDRLEYPLGFETTWKTGHQAPQTGSLRVMLRHIAFGKNPDSPPTAGHSDIQVDFPLIILHN